MCVCVKHSGDNPLSINEFHKNKNSKDGYKPYCKVCSALLAKDHYDANKEAIKAKTSIYQKTYPGSHRKSNVKWKAKNSEYDNKYYVEHKEHILAQMQERYQHKVQNHDYRTILRERSNLWRKQNPQFFSQYQNERRARLLKAIPLWFKLEKQQIKELYARCREISIETGILHHVDHVVPLTHPLVQGLHCLSNLRIIPATENQAKGNKLIRE